MAFLTPCFNTLPQSSPKAAWSGSSQRHPHVPGINSVLITSCCCDETLTQNNKRVITSYLSYVTIQLWEWLGQDLKQRKWRNNGFQSMAGSAWFLIQPRPVYPGRHCPKCNGLSHIKHEEHTSITCSQANLRGITPPLGLSLSENSTLHQFNQNNQNFATG